MSAHTPGPWRVSGFEKHVSSRMVMGSDDFSTAFIDGRSTEENKANARLIAAAPDLYEACQAAFLLLSEYAPIWAVKVEDQLREALAKVRE